MFGLFLLADGYPPQGLSMHIEWIRQRPFHNVEEWLGEPGMDLRRQCGMYRGPRRERRTLGAWRRFLTTQDGRPLADIGDELHTQLVTHA